MKNIIEIIDFAKKNFQGEGEGLHIQSELEHFPLDLEKSNPKKVEDYMQIFYLLYSVYDEIAPNLEEREVRRLFHGIFFGENCDWHFGHSVFEDIGVIKKNVDLLKNYMKL